MENSEVSLGHEESTCFKRKTPAPPICHTSGNDLLVWIKQQILNFGGELMSLGTQCKPWPNLKTPIPPKTYLLLQHLLRFLVKSEAATPATPPQSPISLILPIPQTPTQLPSESSGDTRSDSTANGILTPGAPPFSLAFPSLPLVGSSRAPILSPLDRMTLLHALPLLLLPMTAMLAADGACMPNRIST